MEPFKNLFSANYKKELFQFLELETNSKSSYFSKPQEFKEEIGFRDRSTEIGQSLYLIFDKNFKAFASHCLPLMQKHEKNRKLFHDFFWDPLGWIIQNHGPEHFETAIPLLESLTKLSTAEFAIRPFIAQYPDKAINQMELWSKSSNVHLRRLASEGSRPRLPWGMNLKVMIREPERATNILENLKHDKEAYVQKSVANHLNDQSRLNPAFFYEIIKRWSRDKSKSTQWIIKHALRSEIKAGSSEALQILGVAPFNQEHDLRLLDSPKLQSDFSIELVLSSNETEKQRFIADFELRFPGKKSDRFKVFKGWNGEIDGKNSLRLQKKFSLRDNSIRKFYPGEFEISIMINGKKGKSLTFACS